MTSNIIYQSQTEWDNCNKSLSDLFNIEYNPSIIESPTVTVLSQSESCYFNGLSGEFIVYDPDNNMYEVDNMRKFCRDNKLSDTNMIRVSKNKSKSHKGWVCYPLKDHTDHPKDYFSNRTVSYGM